MKKILIVALILTVTLQSCFIIRIFHKPKPGNWWMRNGQDSVKGQWVIHYNKGFAPLTAYPIQLPPSK